MRPAHLRPQCGVGGAAAAAVARAVDVDVDVDVGVGDDASEAPRVDAGQRRDAHRRPRDALPGRVFRVRGSFGVVVVENKRVAVPRDALHERTQGAIHQELEPVAVTRARRVFVRGGVFLVFVRGGVPLRVPLRARAGLSRRQRVRFLVLLRVVAIVQAHARLHGAAPRDGHRRRRRRSRAAEVLER
jgi:hypothetical protein